MTTRASAIAETPKRDRPRSRDYDGDNKSDLAVYRATTGRWSIMLSATNYTGSVSVVLGIAPDIPVPGDYDDDGKADVAVFRPSTGGWSVQPSSTNHTWRLSHSLGQAGDMPVPGDYGGDGKTDSPCSDGRTDVAVYVAHR